MCVCVCDVNISFPIKTTLLLGMKILSVFIFLDGGGGSLLGWLSASNCKEDENILSPCRKNPKSA